MLRTVLHSTRFLTSVTAPTAAYTTKRFASTMGDKVIHAHNGADLDSNLAKAGLVVVDFSAEWCGPCKMIAPKYAEFSNKYTNVTFVHVDVDEVTEHDQVKDISGVPHFRFFKSGKIVTEFSGANVQALQKAIEANL